MGDVHLYARAEIAGARKLVGKLATKARERESYWVLVEWQMNRTVATVGAIQYFFTFSNVPGVTRRCGVFYALLKLYKCNTVKLGYKHSYVVKPNVYDESVYPRHEGLKIIALQCIQSKLTRCSYAMANTRVSDESGEWYFMDYGRSSLG